MRRLIPFSILIAAAAAAACGGRAATKRGSDLSETEAAAIKSRAASQHRDLDRAAGVRAAEEPPSGRVLAAPTGTAEPEAPERREVESLKGRILGKDAEGCTWVVGESTIVVGPQDTPAQSLASAVEQARAAAVQDFLGVDIRSSHMDFQQEGLRHEDRLIENILQTQRNGRIIKEKVVDNGYRGGSDCRDCRYHVSLKACVLPLADERDRDFRVTVELSRDHFVQGEEAQLKVTATRDCSVYLYDVYDQGRDNKTALVVPNEAVPSKTLKAGETWVYPDEEARKRGVHLVAELPNKDDEKSGETLKIVASKTPLPASVYDPTDGGYMGVLRRLHRSKADWVDDAASFTIFNR